MAKFLSFLQFKSSSTVSLRETDQAPFSMQTTNFVRKLLFLNCMKEGFKNTGISKESVVILQIIKLSDLMRGMKITQKFKPL